MSDASERASVFVQDLGEAARNNPLSAALIGMGALWLLTGRGGFTRIPDVARDAWQGTASGVRSGAESVQNAARAAAATVQDHGTQAAEKLSESGATLASSVTDYAAGFPDMAGNVFDDVRTNLGEMFRAQPLVLGAVGIAIGAAIAASLPTTETEAAYLGETSDYVKQKAGEIAGEQTERATEIGNKVVQAVTDEAHRQGLTTDGIKGMAKDLSDKVSRVADAARQSTTEPRR
jgi:hypothetical protein